MAALLLAVESSAGEQSTATATTEPQAEVQEKREDKPLPFHGSTVSYGHSATALTFAPLAQPFYDPTWGHRLVFLPELHLGEQFVARGRFSLFQEFTLSDSTTRRHEVEPSDVWLDLGVNGWEEKTTKLLFSGDVRVVIPTSKASQAQTRVFSLGPSLSVTRTFAVRSGLTLNYMGRFTTRFNRFTTAQNSSPAIAACGDAKSADCAQFLTTGSRNPHFDLFHGLSVTFLPWDKVTLSTTLGLIHYWLYPLAPAPTKYADVATLDPKTDVPTRALSVFLLSATYQVLPQLGLTLGAWTYSDTLGLDGRYEFPLFNRNTTIYLEAAVDIEATVSSVLKRKRP